MYCTSLTMPVFHFVFLGEYKYKTKNVFCFVLMVKFLGLFLVYFVVFYIPSSLSPNEVEAIMVPNSVIS